MDANIPGQRSILLVCQNDATYRALSGILKKTGQLPRQAPDAIDAWTILKEGNVSCIVLDLNIGTTHALTLFRSARTHAAYAMIPFVFMISDGVPPIELIGAEEAALTETRTDTASIPDAWLMLPCTAQDFLNTLHAVERNVLTEKSSIGYSVPKARPSRANSSLDAEESGAAYAVSSVFAGRIGVLDLAKIIYMVEPLRLTGVLRVADEGKVGHVFFVDGAVRHADFSEIEGEEALFLLLHLKGGVFRFDTQNPTTQRTIEGNTMALLLEGLRQMDETKAIITAHQQEKATRSSFRTPAIKPDEPLNEDKQEEKHSGSVG